MGSFTHVWEIKLNVTSYFSHLHKYKILSVWATFKTDR